MSHSSGISVSHELLEMFAAARKNGDVRWIMAHIVEESVEFMRDWPLSNNFEADFRKIQEFMEPKKAVYVIVKLDDEGHAGSSKAQKWLLITFAPDIGKVKDKMLIASTRDATKRHLGLNYIAMEMYASCPSDASYEAYKALVDNKESNFVYTASERSLQKEATLEVHHGTVREYVHSVQFPMDKQCITEIHNFKKNSKSLVQMEVNPNSETIDFVKANKALAADLVTEVPADKPSFTLYNWNHTYEGKTQECTLFIYCCPQTSHVKHKMLFSTTQKAAISAIENEGVTISHKLEVDAPEDLKESELFREVHPNTERPTIAGGQKFSRPKRPGKGGARMTRK